MLGSNTQEKKGACDGDTRTPFFLVPIISKRLLHRLLTRQRHMHPICDSFLCPLFPRAYYTGYCLMYYWYAPCNDWDLFVRDSATTSRPETTQNHVTLTQKWKWVSCSTNPCTFLRIFLRVLKRSINLPAKVKKGKRIKKSDEERKWKMLK